jgi:hypothetical protein
VDRINETGKLTTDRPAENSGPAIGDTSTLTWKKPSVGRSGNGVITLHDITASALHIDKNQIRIVDQRKQTIQVPSAPKAHFYCTGLSIERVFDLALFIDLSPINSNA